MSLQWMYGPTIGDMSFDDLFEDGDEKKEEEEEEEEEEDSW